MLLLGVMCADRISPKDAVLLLSLALFAGAWSALAPCAAIVGGLVAILCLLHLRSRSKAIALLALALAGSWAGWLARERCEGATRRFIINREYAANELRSPSGPVRCEAQALVLESPVLASGVLKWQALVSGTICENGSTWSGTATLYGGPLDLARGDRLAVSAVLGARERFLNPSSIAGLFRQARAGPTASGTVVEAMITSKGRTISSAIDHARAYVRSRIAATYVPDAVPFARALVLGESDLAGDDVDAFRTSGLAHLLAVSGMHLVLAVGSLVSLCRAGLARMEIIAARYDVARISAGCGIALAWLYCDFAGNSGSARRAAWMLTFMYLAQLLGRRTTGTRACGLSIVALAIGDPLFAFDTSLILSVAATLGLLAFSGSIARAIHERLPSKPALRVPLAFLGKGFSATLAASIACAPVLAADNGQIALGGLVANSVAVPIGELAALPICLLHVVLSPFPVLERGAASLGSWSLLLLRSLARVFANLRFLTLEIFPPSSFQLAVVAIGIATLLATTGEIRGGIRRWTMLAMAFGYVALEHGLSQAGNPRGVLRVTYFDVGQGDSALIDLPNGECVLLDAGGLIGSPVDTGRMVEIELRARRKSRVPIAILSHPHPDHFMGFLNATRQLPIGEIWDTGQGEREGTGGHYNEWLERSRARGTVVRHPDNLCGTHRRGGVTIDVLAPCPDADTDFGANDNSFVIRFTYGARSFLFVGDAERHEEEKLVVDASRLRADVLKVGHHGSRTSSSPTFLDHVAAPIAVVSAGVRNRFGHPHPETTAHLKESGAAVFRTDKNGAIMALTDGKTLAVSSLDPGKQAVLIRAP